MCLNEGTIQAFLDGELDAQLMEAAADHIADCEMCAFALSVAEDESVTAFCALEREFDSLVPTHRLWSKINDSIETEKRNESVWHKIIAGAKNFGFNFTTVTAFASLVIVGGIFAAAWMTKEPIPRVPAPNDAKTEVAVIVPPIASVSDNDISAPENVEPNFEETAPVISRKETANEDFRVSRANYVAPRRSPNFKPEIQSPEPPKPDAPEALPGEETYIKTIASLQTSVERQKDMTLKPSARFAYEKDMAVLDSAIKNLKTEVNNNPKNDGAKKLLLASYQNKIDLLNSVSEKNEMMASLK